MHSSLFKPESLNAWVIASHNAGKVKEIQTLLSPLGISVLSAATLHLEEPEETGSTFAENARLKSLAAAKTSGLAALSDDSGLSVDALGGAPGIYSARWAGPAKDFTLAMHKVHEALIQKHIPQDQWDASFVCVLSLATPEGESKEFTGEIKGRLTFPPRGDKGFGYDPIFIPHEHAVTFAEMEPDAKQAISHRGRAFAQLLKFLSPSQSRVFS